MNNLKATCEAINDLEYAHESSILCHENSNGANMGMCDHYETDIKVGDLKALVERLEAVEAALAEHMAEALAD